MKTPVNKMSNASQLAQLCNQVVVIDTETGGLNPYEHSILSIGLTSWDQSHKREIFVLEDTLCTHPRSMEINRIDIEWIKTHGVSPEVACDQIEAFISQLKVPRPLLFAGHNLSFDLAFLRRLYRHANRSLPSDFSHRSIDTHSLLWSLVAVGTCPPEVCTSDGAFNYFNVSPPEHLRHTAMGDALATRDLLEKILHLANHTYPQES